MVTVSSSAVRDNTFLLSLHVREKILKFLLNIDYLEDPDENSLKLMTSGPKGTAPSGSIKGLEEGKWYEIVISQQKEWVNKLFF